MTWSVSKYVTAFGAVFIVRFVKPKRHVVRPVLQASVNRKRDMTTERSFRKPSERVAWSQLQKQPRSPGDRAVEHFLGQQQPRCQTVAMLLNNLVRICCQEPTCSSLGGNDMTEATPRNVPKFCCRESPGCQGGFKFAFRRWQHSYSPPQ